MSRLGQVRSKFSAICAAVFLLVSTLFIALPLTYGHVSAAEETAVTDANQKFWTADGVGTTGVKKATTETYWNFIEAAYTPAEDFIPTVIVSDGRRGADRPAGKASQDIIATGANAYRFEFYGPLSPSYPKSGSSYAPNDYSPFMYFSFQGINFMLSGDAEDIAEEEFVSEYGSIDFDADVIKLGHHGSRSSSTEEYLDAVSGDRDKSEVYTVISVGVGNQHGHPSPDTLERLSDMGFDSEKVLRTNGGPAPAEDIVMTVEKNAGDEYILNVEGANSDSAADGKYDSGEAVVHFIDVEQADCAIIEFPDGKKMLIDGGERGDSYANKITAYIEEHLGTDFQYFDYAILTHTDSDHAGSMDNVLLEYPSRVVYRPNVIAAPTADYADPCIAITTDGIITPPPGGNEQDDEEGDGDFINAFAAFFAGLSFPQQITLVAGFVVAALIIIYLVNRALKSQKKSTAKSKKSDSSDGSGRRKRK